ncbi:minor extracellular protease Epr [Roseovarius sp. MBR-79]
MRVIGLRVLVCILWLVALGVLSVMPHSPVATVAWADDGGEGGDSDSGDDGDSSDDGGSSSSGSRGGERGGSARSGEGVSPRELIREIRRIFRGPPEPPRRASPRRQAAPRPDRAPAEVIARGLTEEQETALVDQGYVVLEQVDLFSLATTAHRLRVPEGTSLEEARDAIRALPGAETADFNHYYRAGQGSTAETAQPDGPPACEGLHCAARGMINWPSSIGPEGCGAPVTIGMVDTGLNTDHEVLSGADIDLTRITPEDYLASAAIHGTAVASILVGDPESRVPGLLPGLPLVAVDAFHKVSGDERADAFTLVRALDHLSERGAQVINLSLAGPPNSVLEDTLLQLTGQRGIPVIAAAGNDGPRAEPAYPAAYDNVIAVTAVDRGGTIYRRAIRGPHVEIAAPGVEVWTAASVKGARWQTGTSFAAPYVTAAVALWLQHDPMLTPADIRARLTASARDLGPDGPDETFGQGVLDLGGTCPGQAVIVPSAASAVTE